jgi:hypothetical protein
MADEILIPENYYTAQSKTLIYFRSKQTKMNAWEIMFSFETSYKIL